ncbi:uncharacterized protein EDB91DRAFT_1217519 [Suillus paluster]|uniref:uncharacterized protein n=1 Tax=Suillus paluster TaxID=48578 RepID=UPI001B8864EE|nr:uncharacterized protein EDB91DRAFT_1217519 [Suillus paluster]KAG1749696.1 hypothetical protein EDB91DRAFT_1217519 [Suillus paluster]
MEFNPSTSTSTIRTLHAAFEVPGNITAQSQPSSPRSSALTSSPNSPSESVSSLPSVGSSFFFSSAAASPPRSQPQSDHARDSTTQGLIIPSLTLPAPLRRPTPFGKTLGDLRLIVVGNGADDRELVSSLFLDDNEDVVDISGWEDFEHGSILRASTDWIEHRDAHGLEKFEPAKNVEIIALARHEFDNNSTKYAILPVIQSPFHSVSELIDPRCQPSAALANLIASPWSPLHTALIILSNSGPSASEDGPIDLLTPHIPVIVMRHGPDHTHFPSRPHMSSFRPRSAVALRSGLFRSPETLSSLRYEAAERFLRWREVECAVEGIHACHRETVSLSSNEPSWNKAKWEAEWESRLSQDVANSCERVNPVRDPVQQCFDPLHLSSLVSFSMCLLDPARRLLSTSISTFVNKLADSQVRIAMAGSLCLGIGIGMMIR